MVVAQIEVSGVYVHRIHCKKIPAGIIGAKVAIEYKDPMWDALTKTVVFRGFGTKDVLCDGNLVTIPREVVSRQGVELFIGIYGVDSDGKTAIPTIEKFLCKVGAAADPSGDESTDPSLPVWAQLQSQVDELKEQEGGSVDPDAIQEAVEKYLEANPPAAASITINGEGPDENGNFIVSTVSDAEIAQLAAALT